MDDAFLRALARLPTGYSRGSYCGGQWGVSVERSDDGRRVKLFGESLGGNDHVSFNLYRVAGAPRLKPCEMPASKVIAFVQLFEPDQT